MNTNLTDRYDRLYKEALSSLDRSILFTSRVHGVGHIERVINLGAHVAQNESLDDNETKMLLFCCSYHDIGRHSDWLDRKHGSKSARLLEKGKVKGFINSFDEEDRRIILASIAAHSDSDKKLPSYEVKYGVSQHSKYETISSCLKDADNLDRVRLKDLNVKYLRHEKSIALAIYAQELFDSCSHGNHQS